MPTKQEIDDELRKQEAEGKEDYMVLEFRYGRMTRLFGCLVDLKEQAYLTRFRKYRDERTDIGGVLITLTGDRAHVRLHQWVLWVVPNKRIMDWLNNEGGQAHRLGHDILRFVTSEPGVKPRSLDINIGWHSLAEALRDCGSAVHQHNHTFAARLWQYGDNSAETGHSR